MVEKVISGERAQVSRWDLPDVESAASRKQRQQPQRGLSVQELEALQQSAYDEAYQRGQEEGHKAGYDAGYKEGIAGAQAVAAKLQQVLDAMAEPRQQLDEQVEEELVDMTLQIAQQVIRREIQTQPGEVLGVVREAVAMLPMASRDITVRLHPDDAAFLRESWGESDEASAWRLAEDPSLSRGGCVVQTPSSRIDATVERRIAAVARELLGGERHEDQPADDDADPEAGQ